MLIDFIPAKSKVLYQRISDSTLTFTSNNNLSFRLSKKERENIYKDSMTGGEDVYVCIKLLKQGHKYLVDNDLQILHKPRPNLKSLLKQFYNYGIYSVEALSNLELSKIEVFYNLSIENDEYSFLTKKNFPIKGLIYLSLFLLHQTSLILFLFSDNEFIKYTFYFFLVAILLKEIALFLTFSPVKSIPLFLINYLVNWSFSLGALVQSIKSKVLFIPPQLRKSKAQIPAILRVFRKNKIPNDLKNKLLHTLQSTFKETDNFSFISNNTIRVLYENEIIILRRFELLCPFYIIKDYYKIE